MTYQDNANANATANTATVEPSFRERAASIKLAPTAEQAAAAEAVKSERAARESKEARRKALLDSTSQSETTRQLIKRLYWKNNTASLFGRWTWLSVPFVKKPRLSLSAHKLAKLGAFPAEIQAEMIRLVGNVDALNNAFYNASKYEAIHALLIDLRANLEAVSDWFRGTTGEFAGERVQLRTFPRKAKHPENFTGELISLSARIYSNLLILVTSWNRSGTYGTLLSTPVMALRSHLPMVNVSDFNRRREVAAFVSEEKEFKGPRGKATRHIQPIPCSFFASDEAKASLLVTSIDGNRFHPLAIDELRLRWRTVNSARAAVTYFEQLVADHIGTRFEANWRKQLANAEYKLEAAIERSESRYTAFREERIAQHMPVPTAGITAEGAAAVWTSEWKGQRAKRMPSSRYLLASGSIADVNRTVSLVTRKGEATAAQVEKVETALVKIVGSYLAFPERELVLTEQADTVRSFVQAAVDVMHSVR